MLLAQYQHPNVVARIIMRFTYKYSQVKLKDGIIGIPKYHSRQFEVKNQRSESRTQCKTNQAAFLCHM